MKNNLRYICMLIIVATTMFSACTKQDAGAEINLSYKMLADKTWYLEYAQITTGANTITKTYVGQSTYFINFLENRTTNDSDGLTGTYYVQKPGSQLLIQVQVKTSGGNTSNYNYQVVSLGDKNMVLENATANGKTRYYYSTQK
jgi:hypothetical protein